MRRLVPVLLLVLLAGCAPGSERFTASTPAGFWFGLWHGCISFFTLVIGVWSDSVHVYEVDNSGGWYDLGFVLGVGSAWGRSGAIWKDRRKKKDED